MEKFDKWIRELDEDVIQGEYGYERGEFTVYPEHWRPLFKRGLSPAQAFDEALKAAADARKLREEHQRERWAEIQRMDAETLAKYRSEQA
jgi:hypothetical protein